MKNIDKYLKVINYLRNRYTENWRLVLSTGLTDSKYSRLEKLAFERYMNN